MIKPIEGQSKSPQHYAKYIGLNEFSVPEPNWPNYVGATKARLRRKVCTTPDAEMTVIKG